MPLSTVRESGREARQDKRERERERETGRGTGREEDGQQGAAARESACEISGSACVTMPRICRFTRPIWSSSTKRRLGFHMQPSRESGILFNS